MSLAGLVSLYAPGGFLNVIIFLIMVGIAIACAVIRWFVITIVDNTEYSFVKGIPRTEKITGIGIFSIISGCITALSLVSQFESVEFIDLLPTLLGSTFSILIGCVMLSYKNTLEWIQDKQENL